MNKNSLDKNGVVMEENKSIPHEINFPRNGEKQIFVKKKTI